MKERNWLMRISDVYECPHCGEIQQKAHSKAQKIQCMGCNEVFSVQESQQVNKEDKS